MKKIINEKVTISALVFGKNLDAYPRRMEYRGRTYNFADAGLRCLVSRGEKILRIITMSDGKADYRLRYDEAVNDWTLLSIVRGA